MRVLIYGVNSENKGAQLLLAAAATKLQSMGFEVAVSARDVHRSTRAQYGARGIYSIEKLGVLRSLGLDWLPRSVSSLLPVSGDAQFDYVLDASGFSLTDAWGMAPVTSRLSRLSRWKSKGIGFAMLPQAFGPFTNPDVARGVSDIFSFAEVVWARDTESLRYASGSDVPSDHFQLAPDITIDSPYNVGIEARGATLLVPNWNLAKRSGESGGQAYVDSLIHVVKGLRSQGREVVGLCHEGARDLSIITEVAKQVGDMKVLNPPSGTACKDIIAGADLVIAGRYHALVSGLSAGVPVVGHSWSHKYAALMRDFGVVDGLADPLDALDTLSRVESLDLVGERQRLVAAKPHVAARVESVWKRVSALISSR